MMCPTNPFESFPAVVHWDGEFEFGSQSIINVKRYAAHLERQSLAKVFIVGQVAKYPTAAVEVDVDGPWRLLVILRGRLEYADGDLASFHGTFFLGDYEVAGIHYLPPVCNGIPQRVPAVVLYRDLMRG